MPLNFVAQFIYHLRYKAGAILCAALVLWLLGVHQWILYVTPAGAARQTVHAQGLIAECIRLGNPQTMSVNKVEIDALLRIVPLEIWRTGHSDTVLGIAVLGNSQPSYGGMLEDCAQRLSRQSGLPMPRLLDRVSDQRVPPKPL